MVQSNDSAHGVLTIDWLDQAWTLLAEKALHWPAQRVAIVADVHFGKAATFRHHGVPVPEAATAHDLARLTLLIRHTRCERLIVLGDLLHARAGRAQATLDAVARWRASHAALAITLVRGNHDQAAGDPPDDWNIECVDEPFHFGGVHWQHLPAPPEAQRRGASGMNSPITIAGHVHPCVRLRDVDGTTVRAPAFVFSHCDAVLPAFGSFTGGHALRPRAGDRVFAVGPNQVTEVEVVRAGR